MSDLAASGGYYIALAGDEIVAEPGTLTGSIGIYTGKIVYGGTLEKVGVTAEAVTSGANADIYSPLTTFTPAQRQKVEAFMRDFYTGFLDKTARRATRRATKCTSSRRGVCGPGHRPRRTVSSTGWAGSTWQSRRSRNGPTSTRTPRWRP
jgi:protease-4